MNCNITWTEKGLPIGELYCIAGNDVGEIALIQRADISKDHYLDLYEILSAPKFFHDFASKPIHGLWNQQEIIAQLASPQQTDQWEGVKKDFENMSENLDLYFDFETLITIYNQSEHSPDQMKFLMYVIKDCMHRFVSQSRVEEALDMMDWLLQNTRGKEGVQDGVFPLMDVMVLAWNTSEPSHVRIIRILEREIASNNRHLSSRAAEILFYVDPLKSIPHLIDRYLTQPCEFHLLTPILELLDLGILNVRQLQILLNPYLHSNDQLAQIRAHDLLHTLGEFTELEQLTSLVVQVLRSGDPIKILHAYRLINIRLLRSAEIKEAFFVSLNRAGKNVDECSILVGEGEKELLETKLTKLQKAPLEIFERWKSDSAVRDRTYQYCQNAQDDMGLYYCLNFLNSLGGTSTEKEVLEQMLSRVSDESVHKMLIFYATFYPAPWLEESLWKVAEYYWKKPEKNKADYHYLLLTLKALHGLKSQNTDKKLVNWLQDNMKDIEQSCDDSSLSSEGHGVVRFINLLNEIDFQETNGNLFWDKYLKMCRAFLAAPQSIKDTSDFDEWTDGLFVVSKAAPMLAMSHLQEMYEIYQGFKTGSFVDLQELMQTQIRTLLNGIRESEDKKVLPSLNTFALTLGQGSNFYWDVQKVLAWFGDEDALRRLEQDYLPFLMAQLVVSGKKGSHNVQTSHDTLMDELTQLTDLFSRHQRESVVRQIWDRPLGSSVLSLSYSGEGQRAVMMDEYPYLFHPEYRERVNCELSPVKEINSNYTQPSIETLGDSHGTKVVSVIAGQILTGLAPQSQVTVVPVLNNLRYSRALYYLEKTIDWILQEKKKESEVGTAKIRVLGLSMAGFEVLMTSTRLQSIQNSSIGRRLAEKCEALHEAGVSVVIAGGNRGLDSKAVNGVFGVANFFAAFCDEALLVGASNTNFTEVQSDDVVRLNSSSGGEAVTSRITLVAPGQDIFVAHGEDRYKFDSGTSFGNAFIIGLILNLYDINPQLTPQKVRWILTETADKLDGVAESRQGAGQVNPQKAALFAAMLRDDKDYVLEVAQKIGFPLTLLDSMKREFRHKLQRLVAQKMQGGMR